jgi:hypothetical protein
MIIVDDHLAARALAGSLPDELGSTVATTYGFQFRLVRALRDERVKGSLSREVESEELVRLVLNPPADRLVVLDPRSSLDEAADVATRHQANLLLSELVGAARAHNASIRVTSANVGRSWDFVMTAESIDFATL